MLSPQSVKNRDSYKHIWSVWIPESFAAGKPKMTVEIASGSDECLSSCSSIMESTRIMGFAPSVRQKSLIIVIRICEDDTPTHFGTMCL